MCVRACVCVSACVHCVCEQGVCVFVCIVCTRTCVDASLCEDVYLGIVYTCVYILLYGPHTYSLFTFSWPRFESENLRNGGMLILRMYFGVDGMPIEMYGESWIAGLLTSNDVMLYMAGFETTRGI